MKCHLTVQWYTNTCIYTWLGSTMEWEGSREIGWGRRGEEGVGKERERKGERGRGEGGREGGKEEWRKRKRGRREEREECANNEYIKCSLEPRPHLVHA